MKKPQTLQALGSVGAVSVAALLVACAAPWPGSERAAPMRAALPGQLAQCAELASSFQHGNTRVVTAARVEAGALKVAGQAVGEHCHVTGVMHERVSPVDGQSYAIGFEARLPQSWNGRFLYQANGGLDGFVATALGPVGGQGALTHALHMGFAVLSSDAGHTRQQLPLFGLDPQARLDYGYQAVEKLTPMGKALLAQAYGRAPDRSYFSGCSNGGRHALVAASRLPDAYDGILAGAPGLNLPKAAVAQVYGAQQFARAAAEPAKLETALTKAEREHLTRQVLARCDALDGLADGMVHNTPACQRAFDLQRDVATCTGSNRTGQCLTEIQKTALGKVLAGARNSKGEALYSGFPVDTGFSTQDWANWKFVYSVTNRDSVALAFVFMVPPAPREVLKDTRAYALGFDMDRDAPGIWRTDATYRESAMQFMTPPNPADLRQLQGRGAKLLVWQGVSDAVFSVDDTVAWYRALQSTTPNAARDFSRLYLVPGMNHCGGGPATDQFNLLQPLVDWVEAGVPPQPTAQVRGPGNPGGVNPDLPTQWSANRSRPLCAWPQTAHYKAGDPERSDSFVCQ